MESNLTDIARVIQLSVAPAFLLVAIGTLITILSSRLSRIVDRRRVLQDRLRDARGAPEIELAHELALLSRRGNMIYYAMIAAVSGALLVCLVVAGAFVGALVKIDLAQIVASLFVLAMATMIVAWSLFLREVYIAVQSGSHQRP